MRAVVVARRARRFRHRPPPRQTGHPSPPRVLTTSARQHKRQPPAGAMPLGHGPSPEEPMSKAQGSRGKLRFGLGTHGSSRRPVCQSEPEEADDLKDERLEDNFDHKEDIEERSAQSPTTGQAGRAARGRKAEQHKRPQSSRASLRFSPLGSALGSLPRV